MNIEKISEVKRQVNQVVGEHFAYLFWTIPSLNNIKIENDTAIDPYTGEAFFFGLTLAGLNGIRIAEPKSITFHEASPEKESSEFRAMLVEMNLTLEEFNIIETVLKELGTNLLLHCLNINREDFLK